MWKSGAEGNLGCTCQHCSYVQRQGNDATATLAGVDDLLATPE